MALVEFEIREIGTIDEVRKMIVKIVGLPTCAFGQPLTFPGELKGMVFGFDRDNVLALAFDDISGLKAGDKVYASQENLLVPVGDDFKGRIVNGLAEPCDGKGPIRADERAMLFAPAPKVIDRSPIQRQLHTGTASLDAMIPIGKGQRELITGDRVTGKTTLASDAILNQKGRNVICIYCSIGRSFSFLSKLAQLLASHGAMDYTIIVGSVADAPPGEQYLAPYTASSIGEYFMNRGNDVLVIFDDLTTHAFVYRQISLLMNRSPGREAYPGDIFYIHSQLVERAAQLKSELGGGSMTFLPIAETQQGDITGYIPSNLVSMTDGQIYMNSELFKEGLKPAIDFGLSVSRIGSKIQSPALRKLSGALRIEYVKYRELLSVTKLRSAVSTEAQKVLRRGQVIADLFKQTKNKPVHPVAIIIWLFALRGGYLDEISDKNLQKFKRRVLPFAQEQNSSVVDQLEKGTQLTDDISDQLDKVLQVYFRTQDDDEGEEKL